MCYWRFPLESCVTLGCPISRGSPSGYPGSPSTSGPLATFHSVPAPATRVPTANTGIIKKVHYYLCMSIQLERHTPAHLVGVGRQTATRFAAVQGVPPLPVPHPPLGVHHTQSWVLIPLLAAPPCQADHPPAAAFPLHVIPGKPNQFLTRRVTPYYAPTFQRGKTCTQRQMQMLHAQPS
jgi:hypothetical protein